MRVALISLERWDEVWRRNQHLTTELLRQGLIEHMTFVEPPRLGARPERRDESPQLAVLRPAVVVPKRAGGLVATGLLLRHTALRDVDVLWVNDATLGVHCLSRTTPTLYDVTDDWREGAFAPRIRRRLIRAEDRLARRARTVVCSAELRTRWKQRYGVDADLLHNGVDAPAWRRAVAKELAGPAPHIGYLGTLHEERLDLDLVLQVADGAGTLHLVGPDALGDPARARLTAHPHVRLHGPVPAEDVPAWTKAMDVLVSPHVVTPFTLSLDAIKSYEYLASGRPVVATPTSGFQVLDEPALTVVSTTGFAQEVTAALGRPVVPSDGARHAWSARAQDMARLLAEAQVR